MKDEFPSKELIAQMAAQIVSAGPPASWDSNALYAVRTAKQICDFIKANTPLPTD